jgi:F0F1-type ATP synthase assembly protein I
MRPMGSSDQNRDPNRKPAASWTRLSGIGVEFVGAVAVFALVGYWADRHWQSSPWGLLIGLALGLIGGMYNLIREAMQASRQAREEDLAEKRPVESQSNTGDRAP